MTDEPPAHTDRSLRFLYGLTILNTLGLIAIAFALYTDLENRAAADRERLKLFHSMQNSLDEQRALIQRLTP